ncbi:A/G-specific adenine glycosylase [Diplocloster modestus]|uniref:A/G-specific adenine glycosylase n=1 Tax=Diplocloster modestus TaxID=2850322 RepID=UPI00130EB828|nr:A/G-specific adenine glycosylase [Diplocloster modestus]
MELTNIVKPLLTWYDGNARVLPWREDATPYRVWVSEIMLQQTRVEAVKPYFERFTRELPDVQALAQVPEDRLLKLWEGLGYYNRVRNMQKAAQKVVNEFAGGLPADYQQLLALPGIGSYTAGAIASIAYQICVPAVDGNVLRVVSRLTASRDDILKQSVKKRMEQLVGDVIPAERPGAFNQALMELGAMVCVPNGMARCDSCPLRELCEARKQGIVMELPQKTPKKARKLEDRTVLVVRDGEKVAIHRRPLKGLLAGLYEFPNVEGFLSDDEVLAFLKGRKLSPIRIQKLEPSKHIFSHIEWHMIGYVVRVEELEDMDISDWIFIEPQDTRRDYPIPAAFGAYTKYMNIKWGLDNN